MIRGDRGCSGPPQRSGGGAALGHHRRSCSSGAEQTPIQSPCKHSVGVCWWLVVSVVLKQPFGGLLSNNSLIAMQDQLVSTMLRNSSDKIPPKAEKLTYNGQLYVIRRARIFCVIRFDTYRTVLSTYYASVCGSRCAICPSLIFLT